MTPPLHEGQNPVLAYVQPQQEYIYRIDSLPLACNYTIAWPNGTVLAYEVDGFGSSYFMDDANVPSLLSLPYLGLLDLPAGGPRLSPFDAALVRSVRSVLGMHKQNAGDGAQQQGRVCALPGAAQSRRSTRQSSEHKPHRPRLTPASPARRISYRA